MSEMLVGILGTIVGWLLGFFGQSYFSLRSQDVAQINDFLNDLDRIERLSIEYWLNGKEDESQSKVAAQLRGALHASSMFLAVCEKLLANDWEKFEALDGRLFDTATGGEFETAKQAPDYARVVEIMECTNEIRSLLRVARRKTYWAR
jgi:hypothetical protein